MLPLYDEASISDDTASRVVCRRRLSTESDNVDIDMSSQSPEGADNTNTTHPLLFIYLASYI